MNPTTSQDALGQLRQIQSQSQDPNSILASQQKQLGVNDAQSTVTGLRGAINNTTKLLNQVAPSVMGRTGNSLVTNAQASRQISNEQAPISSNLTQEGTDYNQANTDLQNLEQQAQTAATGIYQGQQDKLSYAQNLYNSLYQQEQDKQAESDKQAALAEQIREANLSASAKSGSTFNLGGGAPTPTTSAATPPSSSDKNLSGGKSLDDASTALRQLLSTKNGGIIRNTLGAIEQSARNGNTYDQAKLQIINSQPEFKQYLANINGATF